jgi:hypothetical protein
MGGVYGMKVRVRWTGADDSGEWFDAVIVSAETIASPAMAANRLRKNKMSATMSVSPAVAVGPAISLRLMKKNAPPSERQRAKASAIPVSTGLRNIIGARALVAQR